MNKTPSITEIGCNRENVVDVLFIEDDEVDFRSYLCEIGKDENQMYRCSWGRTFGEALDVLRQINVEVIILDLGLPDTTGLSGLAHLLATQKDSAIVVLTGADSDTIALDALRLGAQDYIVKGSSQVPLARAIRYAKERKDILSTVRKAEALAEKALKAKGEFLANMSHEIRTPMNGVLCMTELLRETSLAPEQKELVEIVHSSAASLLHIINDVLDFSKIEAGKFSLVSEPFKLRKLVNETCAILKPKIAAKDISFSVRVEQDVPKEIKGDPGRLRQIILNLLSNAVKFTLPRGSIDIRVKVKSISEENLELLFSISDTGIGISSEQQQEIFDAFTQADSSSSRQYEGSGLGLTISARLVELMGGRVFVESALDKGSTFHFSARFEHEEVAESTPYASSIDHTRFMQLDAPELSGLKILVVEDNAVNQIVAIRVLEKLGHNVVAVECGEKALEAAQRDFFDIIFMDCQMPGMDGYETTRAIRRLKLLPEPPIVAMTARVLSGDREKCIASGMDDYLAKPISVDSVRRMIKAYCDTSASQERGVIASRVSKQSVKI